MRSFLILVLLLVTGCQSAEQLVTNTESSKVISGPNPPTGVIVVRVISPQDTPHTGTMVTVSKKVENNEPSQETTGKTDNDGKARFRVIPGTYIVHIGDHEQEVLVANGQTHNVKFVLAK